jgi:hypothetical protein
MVERCKRLKQQDHEAAKKNLLDWHGPQAVTFEMEDGLEVWTNSIKVALKLMNMSTRYIHLGTSKIEGVEQIPIYRFLTYDEADEVAEIVNNVPAESIPFVENHLKALRSESHLFTSS